MNGSRISETGCVSALGDGTMEIRLSRSSACAGCGACRRGREGGMLLVVRREKDLDVGRRVRVTFPYRSLWRPIFHVFILPLVLFFAFAAAAAFLLDLAGAGRQLSAAVTGLCALAGAGVGLAAGRFAEARFRRRLFGQTKIEPLDQA